MHTGATSVVPSLRQQWQMGCPVCAGFSLNHAYWSRICPSARTLLGFGEWSGGVRQDGLASESSFYPNCDLSSGTGTLGQEKTGSYRLHVCVRVWCMCVCICACLVACIHVCTHIHTHTPFFKGRVQKAFCKTFLCCSDYTTIPFQTS